MSRSAIALFAVAALVWVGLRLSMYAARLSHTEFLPAHSQRQVWWQANALPAQLTCALIAAAVCMQIATISG